MSHLPEPSLDLDVDLSLDLVEPEEEEEPTPEDFSERLTNSNKPKFDVRLKEIFITSAHSQVKVEDALKGLEKLYKDLKLQIKFIMVVEEQHLDGTPHLHAIVKCEGQKQPKIQNTRFNQIFKKHVDIRKVRSTKRAVAYLQKSGIPVTYGMTLEQLNDMYVNKKRSGVFDEVATEILKDPNYQVHKIYPGFALQHGRKIEEFRQISLSESNKNFKMPLIPPNYDDLYKWKQHALKLLIDQSERQILWIIDYVGNTGKSWFSKYLKSHYNAFRYSAGKWQDIAYAYNYEQFCCFDYPRDAEEKVPYGLFEQFKDGEITSGKYYSQIKARKDIKLIVFSNFKPDVTKMSHDRWQILVVDDPDTWNVFNVRRDSTLLTAVGQLRREEERDLGEYSIYD